MTTVWKFPIDKTDISIILVPEGATLLTLQSQDNVPTIWFLVDTMAVKEKRCFISVVTGIEVPDIIYINIKKHIGTLLYENGNFVAHYFELNISDANVLTNQKD